MPKGDVELSDLNAKSAKDAVLNVSLMQLRQNALLTEKIVLEITADHFESWIHALSTTALHEAERKIKRILREKEEDLALNKPLSSDMNLFLKYFVPVFHVLDVYGKARQATYGETDELMTPACSVAMYKGLYGDVLKAARVLLNPSAEWDRPTQPKPLDAPPELTRTSWEDFATVRVKVAQIFAEQLGDSKFDPEHLPATQDELTKWYCYLLSQKRAQGTMWAYFKKALAKAVAHQNSSDPTEKTIAIAVLRSLCECGFEVGTEVTFNKEEQAILLDVLLDQKALTEWVFGSDINRYFERAVYLGQLYVAERLASYGADVDKVMTGVDNNTLLGKTISRDVFLAKKLLAKYRRQLNQSLALCLKHGELDKDLLPLLQACPHFSDLDNAGNTVLHRCMMAEFPNWRFVGSLVRYAGADLHQPNYDGVTPLSYLFSLSRHGTDLMEKRARALLAGETAYEAALLKCKAAQPQPFMLSAAIQEESGMFTLTSPRALLRVIRHNPSALDDPRYQAYLSKLLNQNFVSIYSALRAGESGFLFFKKDFVKVLKGATMTDSVKCQMIAEEIANNPSGRVAHAWDLIAMPEIKLTQEKMLGALAHVAVRDSVGYVPSDHDHQQSIMRIQAVYQQPLSQHKL